MNALADAHDHLSLEGFRTNLSSDLTFIKPLKQFSFEDSLLSRLYKVFENTARLHLHLGSPEGEGYKDMLAGFTKGFPNLRELLLDFDLRSGSGPLYLKFVSGIEMSKLTGLSLQGLSVNAAHLANSVARLRDVKDLRFYCVDLASGSWPAVLQAISNLQKLEHLHLKYLREAGHKSYFLKQREDADDAPEDFDPGYADWAADHDFDDDDDDNDDSTDDSMPELQDVGGSWAPPTSTSQHGGSEETVSGSSNHGEHASTEDDAMSEYVPGGFPRDYERGFYICIEGHSKIVKRLPVFISEYNTGEFMDETDDGFFPPMGPFPLGHGVATVTLNGNVMTNAPPGLGALLNHLGAPGGMPPAQNNNNNPAGANGNPFTAGGGFLPVFGLPPHFPPMAPAAAPAPAPTAPTTTATTAPAVGGWDVSDQEDWEDEEDDGVFVAGEMD